MHVLVIGQSEICRMGMKSILQHMAIDCNFKEAETIDDGIVVSGNHYFDLIIIHLGISGNGNVGKLEKIPMSNLNRNTVLVSNANNYPVELWAYRVGLSAFISEQTKKEIIIAIFQIVIKGGRYFTPKTVTSKPDDSYNLKTLQAIALKRQYNLTKRQLEVLKLLVDGKANKIIAQELGISDGTIKLHISGILNTLNAKNRTQAVIIANRLNIM